MNPTDNVPIEVRDPPTLEGPEDGSAVAVHTQTEE